VAGWLDEEETAVDTGVLNVSVALGSKFLPQVRRMLVLDVLDDGIPTTISPGPVGDHHLSLLIWSPYPGVSTIFKRRRTPFSSITTLVVKRGRVPWETA
jgi:hypothetical protein